MPRYQLQLISKFQVIPKVFYLVFELDKKITNFKPGQFFSLEVQPKTFRAYSTVCLDNTFPNYLNLQPKLTKSDTGYISFMISTKPGGTASQYFESVEKGTKLPAIGPAGKFLLQKTTNQKVFVATGTGLAPFVCMINELLKENPTENIKLFFGSWNYADSFVNDFFTQYINNSNYPNFEIFKVPEDLQEMPESKYLISGRVTDVIPKVIENFKHTDFYLCGHPMMVESMKDVLLMEGAEKVYFEKFGK